MPTDPDAYWELEAELRPEAEEVWGLHCFEQGALGAEVVHDEGPRRVVRHMFAAAPDADALARGFATAYPHAPAPLRLQLNRLASQPWETAWRAHFNPLRIGRRLLVCPPWHDPPPAAGEARALRIVIDPGQGFGTGWHPSTAVALLALEARLETPPLPAGLLDVGTGSGILAIAGQLLGVPRAWAIDIDGAALPEVRHNFALSGLAGPDGVARGGPGAVRGAFGLVIANIIAEVLLAERAQLVRLTAQDGCLIVSGILTAERDNLAAAYREAGLHVIGEQQRDGWCALTMCRA